MKNLITLLTIYGLLLFLFTGCSKSNNNSTPFKPALVSHNMLAQVYTNGDSVGVVLNESFSLVVLSNDSLNNFGITEDGFSKTQMGRANWDIYVYTPSGGTYRGEANNNFIPKTWYYGGFNRTRTADTVINGVHRAVNHVSRQLHFAKEFPGKTTETENSILATVTDSVEYHIQLMDYNENLTGQYLNGKCKVVYVLR